MSKKNKSNNKGAISTCTLSFGKYNDSFELLNLAETRTLKDFKSEKNSSMPININDQNIYMTEPDGKLIPNIQGQQKCDYLIYCQNLPQTCFIELKGENISIKDEYNLYDQIGDTIKYLKQESELKSLVNTNVEKHAFIVSPDRQKLPKGVETKERQLWQKLMQPQKKSKISDLVHYVKVTKSDRYSNNNNQIICSPKSPVELPFNNNN